jgi:large subunit ribosomal protein L15
MKIFELGPAENSTKKKRRKGRGVSSGRGTKGQNSRSGGGVRPGFEGGQMPLIRRLPKRGFNNKRFTVEYTIVNVCDLNVLDNDTVVTPELLLKKNIISKLSNYGLKVLGNGNLEKKLIVEATQFSQTAKEKIEKQGGKAEVR